MRLGIIILFQGGRTNVDSAYVNKLSACSMGLEICLVNVNDSSDSFSSYFMDVQNISIVNLRKFNSVLSAAKAGARYLFNRSNLEHLGYDECSSFHDLLEIISKVQKNKEAIIKWNEEAQNDSLRRQTQFQRLFALPKFFRSSNEAHLPA